ncbi:unnamed protein product, partial [Laminaria digitata]
QSTPDTHQRATNRGVLGVHLHLCRRVKRRGTTAVSIVFLLLQCCTHFSTVPWSSRGTGGSGRTPRW